MKNKSCDGSEEKGCALMIAAFGVLLFLAFSGFGILLWLSEKH